MSVGGRSLRRGKTKEGGRTRFFLSGGPEDARQCEKKGKSWRGLGRQGRRDLLGKKRREREREMVRKPCWN